jgi:hypothetical protein
MGFYYRKSVNFGPFRINLSRSGGGYSVGGRGFRVGRSARGRRYTAASVPGTGVGYRGSGCLIILAVPTALTLTQFLLRYLP